MLSPSQITFEQKSAFSCRATDSQKKIPSCLLHSFNLGGNNENWSLTREAPNLIWGLQVCICSCWFGPFSPFPGEMFPSAAQLDVCANKPPRASLPYEATSLLMGPQTPSYHNHSRKFLPLGFVALSGEAGMPPARLQVHTKASRDKRAGDGRHTANQNKIRTGSVGHWG